MGANVIPRIPRIPVIPLFRGRVGLIKPAYCDKPGGKTRVLGGSWGNWVNWVNWGN